MRLSRRRLLAGTAAAPLLGRTRAQAAGETIRIGVLTDFSGQFATISGPTSVIAAQQAVEDFGVGGRASTSKSLPLIIRKGRYRRRHRPHVVRPGRRGHDRRRARIVGGPGRGGVAKEKNKVLRQLQHGRRIRLYR